MQPSDRRPPTANRQRLITDHRSLITDILALLVLMGLVILFLWKLAFTNLIIARGDLFLYFYPNWDYATEAIRQGRLPLWNPHLFMGAPFFANSQTGVLYPLNLALAWLPTLRAINLTIILHLWLAGAGMYILARRTLGLSRPAAWTSGATFALGGYLGAQAAHVNQLQALAWLPFLFVFFELVLKRWRFLFALAAVVTLQLFAGHAQSVFISLVGLGIYALWPTLESIPARQWNTREFARRPGVWMGAAALGALLAAVQLVPTLELARQSMRSGGLTWREAVSFSLSPAMLLQALLPNYRQMIFSEYVAYVGVIGLVLAVFGLGACWFTRNRGNSGELGGNRSAVTRRRALSVLALLGLLLALGGFNPIYSLLIKFVPGFNLFRVPARWLVLYAFGAASLVGIGLEQISNLNPPKERGAGSQISKLAAPPLKFGLSALLIVELFLASRPLDYNHPTAPDALTDLRTSAAYLLARVDGSRFLSISPILFDPGDKAELESIFADQLPADALYDLLIATKHKEIVGPNLALYYRLFAADGYDGGVLPLRNYVTFQSLFVPPDKVAPDGRLRENLRDVPDAKWLSLMNVRYIITDKTLDAWLDDVFYDLQFTTALGPTARLQADVAHIPSFEATAIGLVSYLEGAQELPDNTPVARVTVGFVDGPTQTFTLRAGVDTAEGVYTDTVQHRRARVGGHFVRDHPEVNDYVTRLRFDRPRIVNYIAVRPMLLQGQIAVRGASLIDERTGGFQSLVMSGRGRLRLVQSGDVKIYENLDVLPRAFMVPQAVSVPNDADALVLMQAASFDPARMVVMNDVRNVGQIGNPPYTVDIVSHEPERVVIETNGEGGGWLVLTDAWYPGWRATVDGAPVEIARADITFRAVPVPAGQHRVEFVFAPMAVWAGAGISLATLVACTALLLVSRVRAERIG